MSFLKQPFLAEHHVSKSDSTVYLHSGEAEPGIHVPYTPNTAFQIVREHLKDLAEDGDPRFSVAEELEFIHANSGEGHFKARGLACLCERGRSVSITLRSTKPTNGSTKFSPDSEIPLPLAKTEFSASNSYSKPAPHWLSIRDHCEALGGLIFPKDKHLHGLVVICGSTNSAKSLIARGLIHRILEEKCRKRVIESLDPNRDPNGELPRRPHLVTFEDPIEDFLYKSTVEAGLSVNSTEMARRAGVDYTPREKGKDVRDLDQGFADALRQTPAVYFIGEARDVGDWKRILEFAGTGHLVVTTAHAGSLLEMMMKIISACDAHTAAERRHYADKILAVVHMRYLDKPEGSGLLVPSVWRNREKGLAALTASGFSSIVPVESVDVSQPDEPGGDESCFGNHAMFNYVWSFRKAWPAVLPVGPEIPPIAKNLQALANLARQQDI